ncbi:MAG TPA: M13 family metallopeptidase, partial [Chitinophagales bacterium]|nr:M13 family metallopeptidase [Chitinophagales bacterium]
GDDFFGFVNNKWIAAHPIPADKGKYGAFYMLDDNSLSMLRNTLESASKAKAQKGTNTQKVGDFWVTGMDTVAIEKAGITPIKPYLDNIQAIQSSDDLMRTAAQMHRMYTFAMFMNWVGQDDKNSADVIMSMWQGGLGLPDREYYFLPDARMQQIRTDYIAHVKNVFMLLGADEATAQKNASTIMNIEMQMAKASMTNTDMRVPENIYHKMSVADFQKMTPNMNWSVYFGELKTPEFKTGINVAQPEFFKTMNGLMKSVPLDDWKVYLTYHFVDGTSEFLNDAFVMEHFDFHSKKLNGIEQIKPRWKRVVETADFCIGEALGEEYVKQAFSPEAKKRADEMVANIKTAMGVRINQLDWMSDSTKMQAIKKLNSFTVKIGYPDKWRDYSALEIDRSAYVLNVIHAVEFEAKRNYDKIGKPVDKTEWGMTPQTVNAYYNPSNNEIVFPAAILQAPFFDAQADDALNYGGIGAVIGHEITHGFDDQGRQYDAKGNLNMWWTPEDNEKFMTRANVVVTQFNSYCPLDSLCINGQLTLGENIADFGGLTIAYEAYKMTDEYKAGKTIDGITPQQRFFLGFGRIWAGSYREDAMRAQLLTNPHSPGEWRVNGTVVNMPEWYDAWGIKEDAAMYLAPESRAKIW